MIMNTLPTSKITDNIICIKDSYVNAFVYKKGDDIILIDAGNSRKKFLQELNKMNIEPNSIKAVFLTHQDPDHIGALKLFNESNIYVGINSCRENSEHIGV